MLLELSDELVVATLALLPTVDVGRAALSCRRLAAQDEHLLARVGRREQRARARVAGGASLSLDAAPQAEQSTDAAAPLASRTPSRAVALPPMIGVCTSSPRRCGTGGGIGDGRHSEHGSRCRTHGAK